MNNADQTIIPLTSISNSSLQAKICTVKMTDSRRVASYLFFSLSESWTHLNILCLYFFFCFQEFYN